MSTTKNSKPLAPVTITKRYPTFRANRMEIWEATTTDGAWKIARIEMSGTPWEIIHIPTGATIPGWFSTLKSARIEIAAGGAEAQLPEALAEMDRINARLAG